MPPMMDRQIGLALPAEDRARGDETLANVLADELIPQGGLALGANEEIPGLRSLAISLGLPGFQVGERGHVPPEGHASRPAALGRLLANVEVRPTDPEAKVAEAEAAYFGDSQAAARRQPEDDEVLPGVHRPPGFPLQVGQHGGDFGLAQDLRGVDFPAWCHNRVSLRIHTHFTGSQVF